MELDELKNRVDSLKQAQEKSRSSAKALELELLWDYVRIVAESGSGLHKKIAELIMSSGIKSAGQGDSITNHNRKKPFTSFAEFESAVSSEVPFKL
jgi:hypothetical protein